MRGGISIVDFFHGALGIFAFTMLAFPRAVPLATLVLAMSVLLLYARRYVRFRVNLASVAFMALYVAYVTAIFWADDTANGLKYAEYKLSFLVLPFLLALKPNFNLSLYGAVSGLILGTFAASIPGVIDSFECVDPHNRFLYCYTSSQISTVHHPSYFAAFLLVAASGAWLGYLEKWKGYSKRTVFPYLLFVLIFYFLCLSLAGLLYLVLFVAGIFIYWLFRKFGSSVGWSVVVLTPFLIYFLLANTPGVNNEFRQAAKWTAEYVQSPKSYLTQRAGEREIPGNHVRLIMWTVTMELITEHPMGVGTGDVDKVINDRLTAYGFDELVRKDLNSHNQYLQTTLEIGLIGLVLLLIIIVYTIGLSIKRRYPLLLIVVSGLAFNALFESFFQRQSGIVFYSFWIPLLVMYVNQHQLGNRK